MAVILVVDDEASVLEMVCATLARAGHEPLPATTGHEAIRISLRVRPALLLLDLKLADPAMDGLAVFKRIRADLPGVIGVIMTGFGTFPHACESGRAGIVGYISKPFLPEELIDVVDGALAMHRTSPDPSLRAAEAPTAGTFDGMIGASESMQHVFRWILRSAPLNAPVLICGETGTGKELVARSIHTRSTRSGGPFVDVNCSAVPTTLFESEFFGYERGAFTDAREAKLGFFERADDGTLFLDEVGDLALDAQAKLLRVIDQREVLRLGGRRPVPVDVRIVAATNVDLLACLRHRTFRQDLYWRLNGLPIRLPPVRERGGDVVLLVDWFLDRMRVALQRPNVILSNEARQTLLAHDWPGNVREMEHVLRAAVVNVTSEAIEPGDLLLEAVGAELGPRPQDFSLSERKTLRQALADVEDRLERAWIEQALTNSGGNQTQAARRLGIEVRTLYTKMRRHGMRGR